MHGQFHTLAIPEVLENHVAISTQTGHIASVTWFTSTPLLQLHVHSPVSCHCSLPCDIPCTFLKNKCKLIKVVLLNMYIYIVYVHSFFAFSALFFLQAKRLNLRVVCVYGN